MKQHIQYNPDGSISAEVYSEGEIDFSRQLIYETPQVIDDLKVDPSLKILVPISQGVVWDQAIDILMDPEVKS